MTNKEKYLKDEVDIKEFSRNMFNYLVNRDEPLKIKIENFLEEDIKPTLTEDEKVILRSFDPQLVNYISRDVENNITVSYKSIEEERNNALWELTFYNHKFQFIKERRRIQYRGVIKCLTQDSFYYIY